MSPRAACGGRGSGLLRFWRVSEVQRACGRCGYVRYMSVTVILFSFAFYAIWRCNTSNARGAARGDRGARSRARNADRSRRTAKAYPCCCTRSYRPTAGVPARRNRECVRSLDSGILTDCRLRHSPQCAHGSVPPILHTLGVVRPLRPRETRGLGRCRPLTADCRACVRPPPVRRCVGADRWLPTVCPVRVCDVRETVTGTGPPPPGPAAVSRCVSVWATGSGAFTVLMLETYMK